MANRKSTYERIHMPVEVGICLTDKTWKFMRVEVLITTTPEDLPLATWKELCEVYDGEEAIMHWWIQCYGPELQQELEQEAEPV